MTCPECHSDFIPDRFFDCCNVCGDELRRQYERLQDFEDRELTIAVVSSRALFGVTPKWRRVWRVG